MREWTTKNQYKVSKILGGRSNVYLVSKGGRHVIVDSAVQSNWRKLSRRLDKALGERQSADYLILTHTHFDHVQNVNRIKQKYNAEIVVNKEEEQFLISGRNPVIKGTNIYGKFIANLTQGRTGRYLEYEPAECDIAFQNEFYIGDAGFSVRVVHTPGHSQGSSCIIIDDEIAIAGDTMFGIFKNTVFPPFAQDTALLMDSWAKLLHTGCRLYLPGHGKEINRDKLEREYDRQKI